MLKKTKKGFFNNNNITILNNKVVATIFIYNTNEKVVIVQ